MDGVTLLALELTNKGHPVPTDVLQAALQASHTVVGREVAVIPSASDARLEEPPAPSAPSAPSARPGWMTSDSDEDEEDSESSYDEEEDPEVQLLLPAPWLRCGTCEVRHGKDAVGRHLWSYHLSCVEPGCRVAAETHVHYGSTPVDEAIMAGWTKHKTRGWRGASCPAHGWR